MIGEAWFGGAGRAEPWEEGSVGRDPKCKKSTTACEKQRVEPSAWRAQGQRLGGRREWHLLEGLCVWKVMVWSRKRALGGRGKLNGGGLCRLQ